MWIRTKLQIWCEYASNSKNLSGCNHSVSSWFLHMLAKLFIHLWEEYKIKVFKIRSMVVQFQLKLLFFIQKNINSIFLKIVIVLKLLTFIHVYFCYRNLSSKFRKLLIILLTKKYKIFFFNYISIWPFYFRMLKDGLDGITTSRRCLRDLSPNWLFLPFIKYLV